MGGGPMTLHVVVESRRPDQSVELGIRTLTLKVASDALIAKQIGGAGTPVARFGSKSAAEAWIAGQSLHGVVEIEKEGKRSWKIREARYDAPREARKIPGGTERLLALFREKKQAKEHVQKLEKEASDAARAAAEGTGGASPVDAAPEPEPPPR